DWRRVYVLDVQGRVWFSPTLTGPAATANQATWTWTQVTANLLGLPGATNLQRIAAETLHNTRVLLVAGEGGLFRRVGNGQWAEYGVGLPNSMGTVIERVRGADDVLVLGTLGRGAWTIPNASQTLDVPSTLTLIGNGGNNVFRLIRNAARPWLLDVFIYLDVN